LASQFSLISERGGHTNEFVFSQDEDSEETMLSGRIGRSKEMEASCLGVTNLLCVFMDTE